MCNAIITDSEYEYQEAKERYWHLTKDIHRDLIDLFSRASKITHIYDKNGDFCKFGYNKETQNKIDELRKFDKIAFGICFRKLLDRDRSGEPIGKSPNELLGWVDEKEVGK